MPVTGIMKDLIKSRNEGIDLLEKIARSIESGTIAMHSEMLCAKCRDYINANTKIKV
jgi:hypothetical protein